MNELATGTYVLPSTSDPETDIVSVVTLLKPFWVSFNSATNTYTYTPPAGSTNTYGLNLNLTDGTNFITYSFSIIVQTAPVNGAPYFASSFPV